MLSRRRFLAGLGAAVSGFAAAGASRAESDALEQAAPHSPPRGDARIGGEKVAAVLTQYRYDLFDDFLPFMDRFVIDHEHGGFMCHADRDGTPIDRNKYIWYEGRGIWTYAFLFNHLTADERHLEAARRSLAFVIRHDPGDDGLWPLRYTREGTALEPADPRRDRIYGDVFVAEGMAEFAVASGESAYFDRAREILFKCVRIYDSPSYYPRAGRHYLGQDSSPTPGCRILGHWMVLLRVATQMLRVQPGDAALLALADRCVGAILDQHLNPRFDLLNELLGHDGERIEPYDQLVYTGHAIELLWMVMDEADRRGDGDLWQRAADLFRRHVAVAWDDVYSGCFPSLRHIDRNEWVLDKPVWVQEEVLIGTLMAIERTGDAWAHDWFDRTHRYVRDHAVLRRHGFPLWDVATDRHGTFNRHGRRIENYHHPRHLMLNMLGLQRIIASASR